MLKKILLSTAMVGVAFLTGYATAQSYFLDKTSSLTKNSMASNDSQDKNILSPNDFQNQTQELQEKKNQALSNQLKDELSKAPPVPPSATTPPSTPEAGQTTTPESNQPAEAASPANPAPIQEAAPSGPTPAAPPTSAPAQSQVYTGFQNSNQPQNQNQSTPAGTKQNPPPSSGGWNIKY